MVNPETNSLTYRGYPVQELTRRCSFEEVAYLLWHGELPSAVQLDAQNRVERAQRSLDPVTAATLAGLPLTAHPMDTLRTAVSLLGAGDPTENDNSPDACQAKALRLFAVLPAVVAMDHRRRRGLAAIPPRDDLGFAANFLYMTFGEVPDPAITTAFETSLILYAEHSFNASTFTARVVTSTLSDTYSAVTAAIGALKGPLHGGANEAVMDVMAEIGTPTAPRSGSSRRWPTSGRSWASATASTRTATPGCPPCARPSARSPRCATASAWSTSTRSWPARCTRRRACTPTSTTRPDLPTT